MSLLIILMCLGSGACDEMNAPLVIRKELTTAECEREMSRIVERAKAGGYQNPKGGHYALACHPLEPKA
jgi:hypothetical protein